MNGTVSRISIQDVARRARVSTATVSQVINSKGSISYQTRRRVLAVCQQLQYQPHPTARFLPRLRSRATSRVQTGVFSFTIVVSPGTTSTYPEFLQGVAELAFREQKTVVYQRVEHGAELHMPLLSRFGLDGRLVIGLVDDSILEGFRPENTPFVVLGDHQCRQPVWNVTLDHAAAIRLAVNHLWERGHRRFALHCEARASGYQTELKAHFRAEMERRNVPPHDFFVTGEDWQQGDPVKRLLAQPARPTAIIAIQLGCAMQAVAHANALGLRVPDDLSLVLFGRPDIRMTLQSFTHIDPCYEEIGRCGMKLALNLATQEGQTPNRILVQPQLIEGDSCHTIEAKTD